MLVTIGLITLAAVSAVSAVFVAISAQDGFQRVIAPVFLGAVAVMCVLVLRERRRRRSK